MTSKVKKENIKLIKLTPIQSQFFLPQPKLKLLGYIIPQEEQSPKQQEKKLLPPEPSQEQEEWKFL